MGAIGAYTSLSLDQLSARITQGPSKVGAPVRVLPSARVYCLLKVVPGIGLEPTRFWQQSLKLSWLPLHHPGKNYKYFSMIITSHVPPYQPNSLSSGNMPAIYNKILDNIIQSCDQNKNYFILDNTYLGIDRVCELVSQAQSTTDIFAIVNLIDPPFTWHYLKQILNEQFPVSLRRIKPTRGYFRFLETVNGEKRPKG